MDNFRQQRLSLLGLAPTAQLPVRGDKSIKSWPHGFLHGSWSRCGYLGEQGRGVSLSPTPAVPSCNAELPRLNSFHYKLKELIQEEGRGGGKAPSCQAQSLDASRWLKYFI